MKVKIFTEGGKNIGLGHITRCSSLYNSLVDKGILVEFIVYGEIKEIDYLKGIKIVNKNWLDKDYLLNNISPDDYVIIDSYIAPKEIYDVISRNSKRALFIDDIGRIVYPQGIIVNPSLDTSHINYSQNSNCIILSGSKYVILRQQFRDIKRDYISKDVKRILIMMGGIDIRGLTPLIIDNICRKNFDVEFDIVIGYKELEKLKVEFYEIKNIAFHSNLNANQMIQLMMNCDVAITAAGQTIYELLATQTPFIPIQVIDNQKNNIKSLLKYNPNQIILRHNESNFLSNLTKALEIYNSFDYRINCNNKYNNLVDGYGEKRIIDYLLDDINKQDIISLRKIKLEDMLEVYNLSNKEYVRQYSISKVKIEWLNHVKWFNRVLKDRNTVFYVVTDKSEAFLGQIRFEIADNSAKVSISLSENLKGKGLSKEILSKSIKRIFAEKQSVKEIIAFVSEDNIASKKIFEGLKFKKLDVENNMMKLILKREDFLC